MTYDVKQLLSMSQAQLDDLFASSPAGDIPSGEADGTAIIAPGTYLGVVFWGKKRVIDFALHF
jgi:hypothetical protein